MRMPLLLDLDLGIGIQTCTAKMSACEVLGEIYHYSVFALLEFYWNVHIPFFNCFQWITYPELSTYKYFIYLFIQYFQRVAPLASLASLPSGPL